MFRGVTQSNHKPSVAAYFEPRYNVTKDLQLYVGVAGASIAFANRAAAEIDIYGGIRPTFGAFAFDFGVWGYCIRVAVPLRRSPARYGRQFRSARNARPNALLERQRDQEERELLRSLRQGELHHKRHVLVRRATTITRRTS